MSDKFFQLRSYISYWLDAVDEHSLHSPFFFDFYTRIIKGATADTHHPAPEQLRDKLLKDKRILVGKDPGSGSSGKRDIRTIASQSLAPKKTASIYDRMISHFKAKAIIELGTSFGITTLYLAASPDRSVTTFEGAKEVADIASLTFEFAKARNINLVRGDIDQTLQPHLQSVRKVDFVLMDANHRYEPTLRYFNLLVPRIHENSVVVIDDIHYNAEMQKAWKVLRNHKLVYGSADLYRFGILFFDPSLNKQHVILQV